MFESVHCCSRVNVLHFVMWCIFCRPDALEPDEPGFESDGDGALFGDADVLENAEVWV